MNAVVSNREQTTRFGIRTGRRAIGSWRWVVCVGVIGVGVNGAKGEERLPYRFTDFEDVQAFPPGPLRGEAGGFQVTALAAGVAEKAGGVEGESRHLRVSGAVVQMGRRFTGEGKTHLELWVRPRAEQAGEGTEFLDFDGAAVALFAVSASEAEFHALHITEGDQGYWIATGVRVPVKAGQSERWHRISLCQDWGQGTWDLAVDGAVVLEGIGRGRCAEGAVFALWLYGTKDGKAAAFDDVLISPVPPELLEQQEALRLRQRQPQGRVVENGAGQVGPQTQDMRRRQHGQPPPERGALGQIKSMELHAEVVGGGRHIGEFDAKEETGEMRQYALYSPGYDEEGKPKPLQLRLRCDAQLEEGATLAQIQWAITEMRQEADPGKPLRVVMHGTFAKGPTVLATLPSEWSNKPLEIRCGKLELQRR